MVIGARNFLNILLPQALDSLAASNIDCRKISLGEYDSSVVIPIWESSYGYLREWGGLVKFRRVSDLKLIVFYLWIRPF